MENKEVVEKLMEKYLDRNCTEQEIRQLLEYFDQPDNEMALKSAIARYFDQASENKGSELSDESIAIEEVHANLMTRINGNSGKIRKINWVWISAAASLLILVALGAYYFYDVPGRVADTQMAQSVIPEESKEIIDFLDSTRMPLKEMKVEILTQSGGQTIKSNNKSGQKAMAESLDVGDIAYRKVKIPRGGQYELTLSDGTKVWLNAGSTIVFPVSFSGDERRVKIKGEAYFEVAKVLDAGSAEKVPFIVAVSDKAEVKVLGTHFNVNSYPDGKNVVKTTLLEGSVEVSCPGSNQKTIIKPGQQAVITNTGSLNVSEVNTEEVVAWKNGYFYFNNTNLRSIMQDLSRWYDVKVSYDQNIPERRFSGKIQKDLSLNEVIELFKYTNVNIRIENDCIIVTQ